MQKFTRALTREIEVAGERLAVTFSEEGMTLRPVGSRRPPVILRWDAVVCACAAAHGAGHAPPAEQVGEAVKILKGGEKPSRSRRTAEASPDETTQFTDTKPERESRPLAVAGDSLPGLLSRLDRWLEARRPRYRNGLLAGASAADLDRLQEALGRPVPEELRTWLGWHNGQDPNVFGSLEEDWHPMSAAEIAAAKKELDAEGHPGWHREWIPFLDDDNGDFLCLDPTQAGMAVRGCWRGKAEHAVVAPSLAAWVEHFVSGLEQNKYQEDPERGGMQRR
jgi:cell wall assembly regulator SMI1